jgi:GNAT superfamily N-acetyltransferase
MNAQSEIKTRDATTEDLAGIYGLARELSESVGDEAPVEEAVGTRLKELLDEPRARVLVAENEAGIVAEDHRRTGVGKLLMEEVRNVASDNGASQIELVATRSNVTAREFYRSLGFVESDVVSLEFVGSQEDPPEE